jgi:hypothetical protein
MKDKPKPVCGLVVSLRKSATNFKDLIEIEYATDLHFVKESGDFIFLGKNPDALPPTLIFL